MPSRVTKKASSTPKRANGGRAKKQSSGCKKESILPEKQPSVAERELLRGTQWPPVEKILYQIGLTRENVACTRRVFNELASGKGVVHISKTLAGPQERKLEWRVGKVSGMEADFHGMSEELQGLVVRSNSQIGEDYKNYPYITRDHARGWRVDDPVKRLGRVQHILIAAAAGEGSVGRNVQPVPEQPVEASSVGGGGGEVGEASESNEGSEAGEESDAGEVTPPQTEQGAQSAASTPVSKAPGRQTLLNFFRPPVEAAREGAAEHERKREADRREREAERERNEQANRSRSEMEEDDRNPERRAKEEDLAAHALASRRRQQKERQRLARIETRKQVRAQARANAKSFKKRKTPLLEEHNTIYGLLTDPKPVETTAQTMYRLLKGGWLDDFAKRRTIKAGVTKKGDPRERVRQLGRTFGAVHRADMYAALREDVKKETVEKEVFANLLKNGFKRAEYLGMVEVSTEHFYYDLEGDTEEELKQSDRDAIRLYRRVWINTVTPYLKDKPVVSLHD